MVSRNSDTLSATEKANIPRLYRSVILTPLLRCLGTLKAARLTIHSIHPNNVYTDREFVEKSKRLGYKVYPYTVNSIARYEELLDFGVDGVFSNEPEVFEK